MSELLLAIYRGDQARTDELLAANPELDVFEAAALGRTVRLRELLDEDPDLANAWAGDGFQPLGLASFFGHVEAARLLVERGAEDNSASRNDMKVMPLHSAAATGILFGADRSQNHRRASQGRARIPLLFVRFHD